MYPYVPLEILVAILSNLDWRSLVRCQAVCRFWQHSIRDTLSLQYKISLGINGLTDGPPSNSFSLPERMHLLEERTRAWRTLDFKRCVTIPTPGECHAYELVGGMFAKAMNADSATVNPLIGAGAGSVTPISLNPGSRHFSLLKLPSTNAHDNHRTSDEEEGPGANDAGKDAERDTTGRGMPDVLTREDVGVLCRDFGIDPTQDLIALVEQPDIAKPSIIIHLRTISTNEKHPLASVPVLMQPMRSSFECAEIQICDDVIAILVRMHSAPRLVIWEWTSGTLLVHEIGAQSCKNLDDFSLISNYAFMMTSRFTQGSIKVYTFRAPISFSSASAPAPFPARLSDLRCTTLLLPTLQPNNHYAELATHTSPFTARIPKDQPFGTSEEVRVHVMSILTSPTSPPHSSSDSEIRNGNGGGGYGVYGIWGAGGHGGPGGHGGRPASFVVVVLNKCLVRYAEKHFKRARDVEACVMAAEDKGKKKVKRTARDRGGVEIPWEEWGPRNTRWFPERSTHAWQRYVHGARIVRALHNSWPSTRCRIQVLDFNVHPIHPSFVSDHVNEMIDNVEPDIPYYHRLVAGPSLIGDRAVFRGGGVESRLPYREVRLKREMGSYSGFMIDEERIVGLSASAFASGDMKQIDVFTF